MIENKGNRRIWVGAAVAVFAAGVLIRELLRSGRVGGDLLTHWYGHAGITAVVITTAAAGLYFLHRAYRSRPSEPAHHTDPANPS
jgi:hypothetical protein